MDILKVLLFICVVPGLPLARKGARYEHFYIDDGDEIAPEMDLISRKYTKNQHRKWSLAAEDGVWALVFERFSMEYSVRCQHDYLQIEELTNRTSEEPIRPVRYCGEMVPGPYVSAKPRLTVRFVSDDIWEMEGFIIHVLHADDPDHLHEKMEPFVEMAERNLEKSRDKSDDSERIDTSEHPAFYTLIGCSIAALIVFGMLLAYFVISIKNKDANTAPHVTQSFYIQPSVGGPGNKRANDVIGAASSCGLTCKLGKSGKRYSKDNKNNTAIKTVAVKEPSVHHNNLYVSGNLSNNG